MFPTAKSYIKIPLEITDENKEIYLQFLQTRTNISQKLKKVKSNTLVKIKYNIFTC